MKAVEAITAKPLSFPLEHALTDAYLQNQFWRLTYATAGADLSYSLVVPKYVRPSDITPKALSGSGLTAIGQYKTVEGQGPYMEIMVYYESMAKAVQPASWVKDKLKLFHHDVMNVREIVSPQGNQYVDVLSRQGNVITRTTEYVNGKGDYIMLSIFCDEGDYEALAETMLFISTNWRLG